MTGIAIYLEGGGVGANTKSALRRGMSEFLGEIRDNCRDNRWFFKLVACGDRNEAYRGFYNFNEFEKYHVVVLLVDSEEKVKAGYPINI